MDHCTQSVTLTSSQMLGPDTSITEHIWLNVSSHEHKMPKPHKHIYATGVTKETRQINIYTIVTPHLSLVLWKTDGCLHSLMKEKKEKKPSGCNITSCTSTWSNAHTVNIVFTLRTGSQQAIRNLEKGKRMKCKNWYLTLELVKDHPKRCCHQATTTYPPCDSSSLLIKPSWEPVFTCHCLVWQTFVSKIQKHLHPGHHYLPDNCASHDRLLGWFDQRAAGNIRRDSGRKGQVRDSNMVDNTVSYHEQGKQSFSFLAFQIYSTTSLSAIFFSLCPVKGNQFKFKSYVCIMIFFLTHGIRWNN